MVRTHGRKPDFSVRQFRSEVAKLKKAGLVSKRVHAASQKPTRYMRKQVERFRDVLDGKAKALKAPTLADYKVLKENYQDFDFKGRRIIVPVSGENPVVTYSKKTGLLTQYSGPKARRRTALVGSSKVSRMAEETADGDYFFTIYMPNEGVISFDDYQELEAFMRPYERPHGGRNQKPWVDWRSYVRIIPRDELQG